MTNKTYENLKYSIENGEVTITGYIDKPKGKLIIPEIIEGYPVTVIGNHAFAYCFSLSSVKMPNVQTIDGYAFFGCSSITSVEMPNAQSIGDSAFAVCSSLASVEMQNVQTIGGYAFQDCNSIKSVEMPNVQTIGERAFCGCSSITSVEMPNVQTIYDSAFSDCRSIMLVEMRNVQTIYKWAFSRCSSLTSVIMPNVQTISYFAFCQCSSLTSAYFYSDAPTSFGMEVFYECAPGFTIYYAKGTSGWTTPAWNGYATREFEPTNYHYVTFIDGSTGERIAKYAVKDGSNALPPEPPAHDDYTFTVWDSDGKDITADTKITALYEKIL